jgi:uncharacterized membrane-anchored protein
MMRRRTSTIDAPRRGLRRRRRTVIEGAVRIDPRTKNMLHRIEPGEIAIILHEDLDQASAEGLVERGVAAVINCHRSISGRYPNAGPLVLERAGVPLIDAVGEEFLSSVAEGDRLCIRGVEVFKGDDRVGSGTLLSGEELEHQISNATLAIGEELERFVRNTMDYLSAERDLVLSGVGMPHLRVKIAGRPAVVVVRGNEYRADLATLRPYIKDMRPVLIAVDGAADALLEIGYRPDIIIGDMDSVSTGALTCGAEIVVHAYPDGRAPGMERIEGLGVDAHVFASAGTSEDIALLLAYENQADLIVAVGAHDNLVEFLDKGRAGMASTFIVRLKVGPKLVDAKGVNRLYRSQVRTRDLLVLVGSALVAMIVAAASSPGLRLWMQQLGDLIHDVFR